MNPTTPLTRAAIIAEITAMLTEIAHNHILGVLSTVSPDGQPHSVWMGTFAEPTVDQLLTLTDGQSRKAEHIRQHPAVEWMFSTPDMRAVLYLRGLAHIVEDTASIKKAWQQLPDKRRAYFLAYQTEGLGFVIIKTLVTALEYRVPTQNTVGHFSPAELS